MRAFICLALLAGCTTTDNRCDEAAEALASCHGIDPTTFVQACNEAPADEANALVDDVLAQSCPAVDGKADGLGEWAFVEACRPLLATAYFVNQARNPSSAALGAELKTTLRPYYGALVDKVKVHWNATLTDDWPMLHIKDAFMDVGAQTFGSQIYIAPTSTAAATRTLAHELTHAKQAERFGGVLAFYREYCRAFYRSGFSYDGNALEVEAYAEQARITACLPGGC